MSNFKTFLKEFIFRCHINAERRKMLHKRDYDCHKCSKQYGGQTILNIHLLSHKKKLPKSIADSTNLALKPKRCKTDELVTIKKEPIENIKIKVEPL